MHVATTGRDTHPGSGDKPFATTERARDEIRRLKAGGALPAGGMVVEVRGGRNERARAIDFTALDSGTAAAPID